MASFRRKARRKQAREKLNWQLQGVGIILKTAKAQLVGTTYVDANKDEKNSKHPAKVALQGFEMRSGRPFDNMLRNYMTWGPTGVLRTVGEKIAIGPEVQVCRIGAAMEDANVLLKETQAECLKIMEELERTSGKVARLRDVMLPDMRNFLDQMRSLRMAMDQETKYSMASLNEIRHFFISRDYESEIARLKDFLATVEHVRELQHDGTLDVIVDVMLKLACPGEANNGRK